MSKARIKLRIIHETNPQKYFPALFELDSDGVVDLVGTHRYSVVKEWFRAWIKDKTPFAIRTRNALNDLLFRLKLPFVKDETIVIGFAPWDWRLLIYRQLARKNKILYQTSWHDWRLECTPRQPKPYWFKKYMQSQWHEFVNHKNVRVIAVTPIVAETVIAETKAQPTVIPHAVPSEFFDAGKKRKPKQDDTLKLLYVGEISEKKGINELLRLMEDIKTEKLTLTVIGNGPLAKKLKDVDSRINYLGPIYNRSKLAKIMAEHDVLMLLSQRTKTWEELFGIVIVEAIATGCMVIASNHIGPRGILERLQPEWLFDESDLAGVRNALIEIMQKLDAKIKLNEVTNLAVEYSSSEVKKAWAEGIYNAKRINL